MKNRYRLGNIIGKSPAIQGVYELILHTSASDANVFIYGESGTGKELVAWTIHTMGRRQNKAFVPVNCGAIPETLFESEFFGHRQGTFTGANKDKRGLFDYAHGGTLFLDEVGELTPTMQAKLLRAIEGAGYTPLGEHSVRKADVRIIAATNKKLEEMLPRGTMREDFYYRISVIPITLPPLRERQQDIPLLIDHFLTQYNAEFQQSTLPADLLQQLYNYDWPGNIRELQNVLQRYLTTGDLDFLKPRHIEAADAMPFQDTCGVSFHEAVNAFEKQFLRRTLERQRWHRTNTAAMLKISRRSLFRLMEKHGLL